MKRIFTYELDRLKRERVLVFILVLVLLSCYSGFMAFEAYRDFRGQVVEPFHKIENQIFSTTNKYSLYKIKGFHILKEPSRASMSINSNAYYMPIESRIDVTHGQRYGKIVVGDPNTDIPYPFILMVLGFLYGLSVVFTGFNRQKVFFSRLVLLLLSFLLIISPQIIVLFLISGSINGLWGALMYWGVILLLVVISFTSGVLAKSFKLRGSLSITIFIAILFLLHILSSVTSPKIINNGKHIQVGKFEDMVKFQTKEDKVLNGIENKEKIKSIRLNIIRKYLDKTYPFMINSEKDNLAKKRELYKKRDTLSAISPLGYVYLVRNYCSEGNIFDYIDWIIQLEQDFSRHVLINQYSPGENKIIQFEGAKDNIYKTKSALPHNFKTAISIYCGLMFGLFGLVLFKLRTLPGEEEQDLNFDPDFLYFAWLDDEERAIEKEKLVNCGYFPIDKNTKDEYPQDLTFAEIFNLDDETISSFKDTAGEVFETKLKKLSKIEFEMGLLAIKISQNHDIVMDNITADYSRKTKIQFASIVDSFIKGGQCVLYLSNGLPSSNLEVPDTIGGKKRIKRPQPFESKNELL